MSKKLMPVTTNLIFRVRTQGFSGLFYNKKRWLGISLFLVLVFIGIICVNMDKNLLLVVDDQGVALVTGERQAYSALKVAQTEMTEKLGVEITGNSSEISFRENTDNKEEPLKEDELINILKEKIIWVTDSWAISVDSKPVLYLASQEEAQNALDEIVDYYLPKDSETVIESKKFLEDIEIKPIEVAQDSIKTKDEALEAMINGLDKIIQHTVVEGESLWTIARKNDMTVAELKGMNADLKGELLKLGSVLNLKKAEPLFTVVTTMTTKVEEKIPYETVYEDDSSLWKGQQKVKKAGESGARIVTYKISKSNETEIDRQTMKEEILKEPVKKVVYRGTKIMVASRDGGKGSLAWPTRGRITSSYGVRRSSGIHTGVDIGCSTGTPIFSAESGTVIRAGWYGNYGKCVDINHGQGIVTRYAHLSVIDVTVGQKVSRGDIIGKGGSTGNSTGSHLHFEVRVNGKHTNPLRYLG